MRDGDHHTEHHGSGHEAAVADDFLAKKRDQAAGGKGIEMGRSKRVDGEGSALRIPANPGGPMPDREANERGDGNRAEQDKSPRCPAAQQQQKREQQIELLLDRQRPEMPERRPIGRRRVVVQDHLQVLGETEQPWQILREARSTPSPPAQ